MPHIISFVKGVALGAGALYLFDSQSGAARRARLRRELLELGVDLGDEADRAVVAAGHVLSDQAERAGSWMMDAVTGKHLPRQLQSSAAQAVAEEHLSSPWPSKSRMWAGTAGTLLLVYGLVNRRPFARLAATVGLGLLGEGLLHHSESEARAKSSGRREQDPGAASPARSQMENASPSWKVAVPK